MDSLKTVYRAGLRLQRRLMRALPPQLAYRLDRMLPTLASSWGGPMNGQSQRCEIVREISKLVDVDHVIETGTFRGTTTGFLHETFKAPVTTVEGTPRYHLYSQARFETVSDVDVVLGDSRDVLRQIAASRETANDTVFFYLDAHWEDDLPLKEELEVISKSWPKAIVMIDDFEVPDDIGYAFDDYGPGKTLTANYLPVTALAGWVLMYPSQHSSAESGAKRGCCVLMSPELRELASRTSTLRMA